MLSSMFNLHNPPYILINQQILQFDALKKLFQLFFNNFIFSLVFLTYINQ